MKNKRIMLLFCITIAMSFTGCANSKKPAAQTTESETETQKPTEKETSEKATEKVTEKATEKTIEKSTEKQTEQMTTASPQPQTEAPAVSQPQTPAVSQPEAPAPVQTEAPQTVSEGPNSIPSPPVYEEEYLQCPYCAEWFGAQPDGDLWNPYDRHMLEEREIHEGGQMTEQEWVQCPDCLNLYEAGNVFRNHICTGRG